MTPSEILELDTALLQAFRMFRELRRAYKAARHIKFPSLPSIFSESIVIASTPRLFGAEWSGTFGGTACDVRITDLKSHVKRVEVKATAEHAFQEFKEKDLRADVLIWVRFGRRFQEGSRAVEIVLLNEPGRLIRAACRLDTVRFHRLIGDSANLRLLAFNSLEQLLGIVPSLGS